MLINKLLFSVAVKDYCVVVKARYQATNLKTAYQKYRNCLFLLTYLV